MQPTLQSTQAPYKLYEKWLLLLIIFIGAALRFYKLEGTSLYNDELSALNRLRFNNFHDLIQFGVARDGHPAGVHLFLYYWVKLFGDDAFVLRLPFAIAGILAIPYAYAWVRIWFGIWPALFTAATISMLEYTIYYSQLARPYSPGLLFAIMLLYYWSRLLFVPGNKKWLAYFPFILSALLCAYTHHFSMLFATIVSISGLFFLRAKALMYYIIACIIAAVLYLPQLPITLAQLKEGGLSWIGKPGNDYLWFFIKYVFSFSNILMAAIAITTILSVIIGRRNIKFGRFHILALLFFLLPMAIGFIKSRIGLPVLQPSVLLFSFPLLPAFLFSWTGAIKSLCLKYCLLAFVSLSCLGALFLKDHYYSTEHYGQFKVLADKTIAWDKKYGQTNIDHYISINNRYYIQYYYRYKGSMPPYTMYRYDAMPLIDSLFNNIKYSNKLYLLESWSNIGHPEDVIDKIIRLKYPTVLEQDDHYISGIRLYSRNIPKQEIQPIYEEQKQNDTGLAVYQKILPNNWAGHLLRCNISISADSIPNDVELVASTEDKKGNMKFWKTISLHDLTSDNNKSKNMVWYTLLPTKTEPDELMKIYVWNHTKLPVKCTDMKIEIY